MPYGRNTAEGMWAAKACPAWCFTIYDAAARLHCSVRHVRRLLVKHEIATGLVVRTVRLANGRIVRRRLLTLTPSSLEKLMLAHSGLNTRRDHLARASKG